ncbi:MAG: hypothetical protein GXP08_16340 [Gammaproteobacteria bacterium]|nr:hypothetical protein [Gammaproteobacteria bacterium]
MKQIISIIFIAMLLPSLSYAEDQANHKIKEPVSGIKSLSPKLRGLLAKEMQALQNGMQSIIPAYVSGNWNEIAQIADKMQGSYILKQSLSDDQKKELHTSLSSSFLKLDQQFHYLSGMLKHVAKNKKTELIGFYFSKLSETCVSCHTQFATHRFPALEPKEPMTEHSH